MNRLPIWTIKLWVNIYNTTINSSIFLWLSLRHWLYQMKELKSKNIKRFFLFKAHPYYPSVYSYIVKLVTIKWFFGGWFFNMHYLMVTNITYVYQILNIEKKDYGREGSIPLISLLFWPPLIIIKLHSYKVFSKVYYIP